MAIPGDFIHRHSFSTEAHKLRDGWKSRPEIKTLQSHKAKSARSERTTNYDVMFTSYVESLPQPVQQDYLLVTHGVSKCSMAGPNEMCSLRM
jgi:hypothetical protein